MTERPDGQRVTLITLGVRDLGASRSFYCGGLGWQPILDLPEVVFLQVGHGLVVALWGIEDLSADVGTPATVGSSIVLAANLDSAEAVTAEVERWRSAGGTVLKEPQPAIFGGLQAYVADPDGHRWEIAWNPGWTVAADGSVRLDAEG